MKRLLKSRVLRYSLYLLAVLPAFVFRDFTLDNELRYLSIADEALRNGSLFTFTNHGNIYADKPPLYLWIVMAGKLLLGTHSLLFLGLFSFIPALVIVDKMGQWIKKQEFTSVLPDNDRLTGEILLLTSSYFIGSAIVLRMDMLQCMFIVLALSTFFKMYKGEAKAREPILFPVFVFMALFSKGPIGFILPLVSTTVFLLIKKQLRSFGNYWGWKTWAILFSLSALWLAGVYAEGGSPYLNNLVFHQTVDRAVNSFHHKEPFYYYFITIWYSLAPWSLLYIGILVMGIRKKLATTDLELFFLVTALSTIAFLTLLSSKLAVYMLPAFPFLVYLCVLWIPKLGFPGWMSLLAAITAFLLSVALPAVVLSQYFDLRSSWLILGSALILSASGIIALVKLQKQQLNRGIITMGTGILVAVFTISFAIPSYNHLIGLGELCEKARLISSNNGVENYYYCSIKRADNLDVYLGVKPQNLRIKDLYEVSPIIRKPAVLFLYDKTIERNDSLRAFIAGKKIHRFGNYYCVEIENDSIMNTTTLKSCNVYFGAYQ